MFGGGGREQCRFMIAAGLAGLLHPQLGGLRNQVGAFVQSGTDGRGCIALAQQAFVGIQVETLALKEGAKRGEGGAVGVHSALTVGAAMFGIEPENDDLAEAPAKSMTPTE